MKYFNVGLAFFLLLNCILNVYLFQTADQGLTFLNFYVIFKVGLVESLEILDPYDCGNKEIKNWGSGDNDESDVFV